jgi:hypothetical protein
LKILFGNVFEGFMNYICIFKAFGVILLHFQMDKMHQEVIFFKRKEKRGWAVLKGWVVTDLAKLGHRYCMRSTSK